MLESLPNGGKKHADKHPHKHTQVSIPNIIPPIHLFSMPLHVSQISARTHTHTPTHTDCTWLAWTLEYIRWETVSHDKLNYTIPN